MKTTVSDMEVRAVANGRTIGFATFTLTAKETPSEVIATVNYGEKFIDQRTFDAGTSFENVVATIQNLLTPEPYFRH